MTENASPGFREIIWLEFIDIFGKGPRVQKAFTNRWGITPDNVTAIKLWWSLLVWAAILTDSLTPKFLIVGVVCCFLSDFFDGPLKRALDHIGWSAEPFLFSQHIPIFTGRPFDQSTDRIGIVTGCAALIYLGVPWPIIVVLIPWSVLKVTAAFHGAWLLGMSFTALGKAFLGDTTEGFNQEIMRYAAGILEPTLIGRAEVLIQTGVLLGCTWWLLFPNYYLLLTCKTLAWTAFVAGLWSYRIYVRRFLESIKAEFRQFRVGSDLPYTPRNYPRLWLTRFVLGVALYVRLQPRSTGR